MAKRANHRGSQLARGFLLGMLYSQGKVLTTARIRREFRVSKATAKRDMAVIRTFVLVRPSKPRSNMKHHIPQATILRKVA